MEKFSGGSTTKSQTSTNVTDTNDKQVSTQLSDELASKSIDLKRKFNSHLLFLACQINSQQINSLEETPMDIGEFSVSEILPASGEQRYALLYRMNEREMRIDWNRILQSQQSTGDKRAYDINSNNTTKEITQENPTENDGTRNGTIKKRKSEVFFSFNENVLFLKIVFLFSRRINWIKKKKENLFFDEFFVKL